MINEHVIFPYVVAVRVRLVVINFSGIYPCMRIRLSGCPAGRCSSILGLASITETGKLYTVCIKKDNQPLRRLRSSIFNI